jgi:hypothetical protein
VGLECADRRTTGVSDQYIHPAEARHGRVHHLGDRRRIREVRRSDTRLCAGLLVDLRGGALERGRFARAQDDRASLRRQLLRDRTSKPAARAADERHLALEPKVHRRV